MVEAITQAINTGGEDVVLSIADAFALSESGGFTTALALAIAEAWSSANDVNS